MFSQWPSDAWKNRWFTSDPFLVFCPLFKPWQLNQNLSSFSCDYQFKISLALRGILIPVEWIQVNSSVTNTKSLRTAQCTGAWSHAPGGPGKPGCAPWQVEGVGGADACIQPLGVIISPCVEALLIFSAIVLLGWNMLLFVKEQLSNNPESCFNVGCSIKWNI